MRKSTSLKTVEPVAVFQTHAGSGVAGAMEIFVHRYLARVPIEIKHEQHAIVSTGIENDPAAALVPSKPVRELLLANH